MGMENRGVTSVSGMDLRRFEEIHERLYRGEAVAVGAEANWYDEHYAQLYPLMQRLTRKPEQTGIAGIAEEPQDEEYRTVPFQAWADERREQAVVERQAGYAELDAKESDFHAILRTMGETHDRKNSDYANSDTDRYRNFRLCEMAGISAFDGCLTRLSDKFARVMNLAEKSRRNEGPAVADESIEDTLLDMANYAVIALILHREQRHGKG